MIIIYILIGVAMLLMLDTFSNIQQFDLIDASLSYYKNISGSAPARPNGTLTHSIQRRFSELYNSRDADSTLDLYGLSLDESLSAKEFHQKYMTKNLNKLSKTYTLVQDAPITKILSINNEWRNFTPYSTIDMFIIDEDQLYGMNKRIPIEKVWKNCFYNQINGSVEAIAYNEDKGILAGSFALQNKAGRVFRIYHSFSCEYKNAIDNTRLFREHCSEGKSYQSQYMCQKYNITPQSDPRDELQINSKLEESPNPTYNTPQYEDIPLRDTSKIVNSAVAENMIAYTTVDDRLKIHYLYKNISENWVKHSIEYPKTFKRFKFKQNIGLLFIGDSKDKEKQLLAVDIIGNENEMFLIYFVHKFVEGTSLIKEEKLLPQYFFNTTEDVQPYKMYNSIMYDLFKINISTEIHSIDMTNSQSIPRSLIKYNPKTRQILISSLNRYLLLICMKDEEVFAAYQIAEFEDPMYRIKNFAISPSGQFFVFLAQHRNKMKIFLLNNEYLKDTNLNKLYLINFDYSLNPEEKTVLDLKLTKGLDNQMSLILLLEHGEMAVYALHFGAAKYKGGLLEILIEDELDFLSFGLLIAAVMMLVLVKFARSIRININIRRQE